MLCWVPEAVLDLFREEFFYSLYGKKIQQPKCDNGHNPLSSQVGFIDVAQNWKE